MLHRPTVLALSLGVALCARAEEDPRPVVDASEDVVVVVGRREPERDPRAPTRATTRVVTGDRPELDTDLGGPLSAVPSVVLRRFGAPGGPLSLALRGSATDQVVVRLGALPLTPPGGGLVDLSAVPPILLDSVSVTRGSEGAAYGAGALGGVVHLEPLSTGDRTGARLELGAGSFGTVTAGGRASGTAGAARLAGAVAVLSGTGGFSYERDRTPAFPGDPWVTERRDNNAARTTSALFAADLAGAVTITALGHHARRGEPGAVGLPMPDAWSEASRILAGVAWPLPPGPAWLAGGEVRAWAGREGFRFDPGTTSLPGATGAGSGTRDALGAEAGAKALLGAHLVRAGVAGSGAQLVTPVTQAGRTSAALALSDTAYLLGDALTLHLGARVEFYSGLPAQLTPAAGAAYRAAPGLTFWANVGRAVRMPTLHELHAETGLVLGNPELRPEAAVSVDGGVTVTRGPSRVRLAAFHSDYRDLISYELYPPFRLQPFNVRAARIDGVELEAAFTLGAFEVGGVYAFTRAVSVHEDATESGRALPYRPPHAGLVRAAGHLGPVRAYAQLGGQSSMPRNRANTKTLAGHASLDAGVRLALGAGFSAAVQASNLLDDRRREDVFGYPLPGRTILVSARWAHEASP